MSKNVTLFLINQRPKRIDWVNLFEPKAVNVRGADPNKKNFQMDWIFEKDDPDLAALIDVCKDVVQQVAAEQKIQLEGLLPHKDYHWPLQSGEALIAQSQRAAEKHGREWKESYGDHIRGRVVLKTSAPQVSPPILIIPANGKLVQLDNPIARLAAKDVHFYRGMMAFGKVAVKGYYSSEKSWGATVFVNEVVATGKGERIGGVQADLSVYKFTPEVVNPVPQFDPTQGVNALGKAGW